MRKFSVQDIVIGAVLLFGAGYLIYKIGYRNLSEHINEADAQVIKAVAAPLARRSVGVK